MQSCNTREGIGTIAYNAPELFGESGVTGSYDPRPVDVWGIGVTLLVMTVGAYPFGTGRADEDYHATVAKICNPAFAHEPLVRLAAAREHLHSSLIKVVRAAALLLGGAGRFIRAGALRGRLAAALRRPDRAAPVGRTERPRPSAPGG